MQKELYKTKGKYSNRITVNLIKDRLDRLKEDIINKMSIDEIEIEKPYEIVNTVERILHSNDQNQEGQGLKILTPEQMLSRL